MTKKEKLWSQIVKLAKAKAKNLYVAGDLLNARTSSADYKVKTRSTYRVHFCEASDYEDSWFEITIGDSVTGVVVMVYCGIFDEWEFPLYMSFEEGKIRKPHFEISREIIDMFTEYKKLK